MIKMLRVRDWDKDYENNRSREIRRTLWFPAPNDLSADGYTELVGHPDGAAHFGVWNSLLMVASKASPRGSLVRDDGRPHTAESPCASDATARTAHEGRNRPPPGDRTIGVPQR